MSALIVIACIAAYLIIGGAIGRVLLDRARESCHRWPATQKARRTGKYLDSYDRCDPDDHPVPFIAAAFWPCALPVFIGIQIGGWSAAQEARSERREKRAQADHERKMAELKEQRGMTMDAVKFLVENGIKADVPGLYDVDGAR